MSCEICIFEFSSSILDDFEAISYKFGDDLSVPRDIHNFKLSLDTRRNDLYEPEFKNRFRGGSKMAKTPLRDRSNIAKRENPMQNGVFRLFRREAGIRPGSKNNVGLFWNDLSGA